MSNFFIEDGVALLQSLHNGQWSRKCVSNWNCPPQAKIVENLQFFIELGLGVLFKHSGKNGGIGTRPQELRPWRCVNTGA